MWLIIERWISLIELMELVEVYQSQVDAIEDLEWNCFPSYIQFTATDTSKQSRITPLAYPSGSFGSNSLLRVIFRERDFHVRMSCDLRLVVLGPDSHVRTSCSHVRIYVRIYDVWMLRAYVMSWNDTIHVTQLRHTICSGSAKKDVGIDSACWL